VPKLGRWFVLVATEIPLLVVSEAEVDVDVDMLGEDGKTVLEAFSKLEDVLLGIEGATPLPRPAICTFFGVTAPKFNSF